MGANVSVIPALLTAVALGGLLLIAVLLRPRAAVLVVGVMLLLAGISVIRDYYKTIYPTVFLPWQAYRSELFGVMGLVLLAGYLPRLSQLSLRPVSGQARVLLAMGLYAGLLRMYHETPASGAISMAFALATIVPLAVALPAMLRSDSDCERFLRIIVWAALAWAIGAAIQFVTNPRLVVLGIGDRFTGLIANPNQAATMLAVVTTCSLWLALNVSAGARLIYTCLTVLFFILLVWTGSRGGLGMLVLGASSVLYGRIGRAVLLLPFLAFVLYGSLVLADLSGIRLGAERLVSTVNTRAEPWSRMISVGLASPLFGEGTAGAEASENSYLLGFASYGVGMVCLMLLLTGVGALQTVRMMRLRRLAPKKRALLIDFCVGQQIVYFAGAVFEGFMHSRVGPHLVFMLVFAQMGTYLLQTRHIVETAAEEDIADQWDKAELEAAT